MKFRDNSCVKIKGCGNVVVLHQDGQRLTFGNVLFVQKLCAKILSLGRLEEEGCKMTIAEVHRREGRLYLLKLKVKDNCLLTESYYNSSRL